MDITYCLRDSLDHMRIPEAIAVVTGVLSVWFARKESVLVYPVGLVSVLLYTYICFEVKLYADAAIQVYYAVMSVYGWYFWLKGGKGDSAGSEAEIVNMTPLRQSYWLLFTIALGFVIGLVLKTYTDSNVPYWDGITTAIFYTAMLLMARKVITHWVYWIVGDLICIPLFFSKGLCLSSLQYVIFTVLAVAGWMAWNKKLRAMPYA